MVLCNKCVPKDTNAANVAKATNAKPKPTTPPKPKAKPIKAKPIKAKLERCPKGTRRNPKTLLCEVKT